MLRYKLDDKLFWGDSNTEVLVTKCFDKTSSYGLDVIDTGEYRIAPEIELFPTNKIFEGAYFRVGETAYFTNTKRKPFEKVSITDIFEEDGTIYYKCLFKNGDELINTISNLSFESKSIYNRNIKTGFSF